MWTRKLDHAIFVEEEKYIWTETRNKLFWKLVALASLAVMSGVIVKTVV